MLTPLMFFHDTLYIPEGFALGSGSVSLGWIVWQEKIVLLDFLDENGQSLWKQFCHFFW